MERGEGKGMTGKGRRVRVYFGESDRLGGRPLSHVLLEALRRRGAAGATIFHGQASFGAQSLANASTEIDVSSDLPLVLEWIDTPERVSALLPQIAAMVDGGLVTSEDVEIHRYSAHAATGRH